MRQPATPFHRLGRVPNLLAQNTFRLLFCFILVVGLNAPAVIAANSDTPNVILIMADDLGYRELGCYGQKWIKTPVLDHMASEGMKFTNFYSGNAVCAPSRCCLLTGKHPGHAWVRNNGDPKLPESEWKKHGWEFPGQNPIPDEEVTLAEVLKQKNYVTGAMGKWGLGHFGTSGDPNEQGFDLFYGFNCQRHAHNHYPKFLWRNDVKEIQPGNTRELNGETYSQDQFTKVAMEFIEENQKKPFFLYLPYAIPHLSIQVPESTLSEYTETIPEEEYKHRGYLQHPAPRAGYAAMITHMDRDIGKILKQVDELGLSDNTIVIFTSDNGPTYDRLGGSDSDFFESAKPFRGLKGSLYEGGIRVPLIVKWPGVTKPGTVNDTIGAHWDLFATIAAMTGTKSPEDIDGISLVPALKSGKTLDRDFLYWEFAAYGGQQAVRMGKWKGIRQNLAKKNLPIKTELYNLKKDPAESNDVAEEHPQVLKKIEELMVQEHTPSELFRLPKID